MDTSKDIVIKLSFYTGKHLEFKILYNDSKGRVWATIPEPISYTFQDYEVASFHDECVATRIPGGPSISTPPPILKKDFINIYGEEISFLGKTVLIDSNILSNTHRVEKLF